MSDTLVFWLLTFWIPGGFIVFAATRKKDSFWIVIAVIWVPIAIFLISFLL